MSVLKSDSEAIPLREQTPAPAESPVAISKYNGYIKDLHSTLVSNRNLEINLFWQRANYFLVLNSGLAIGFFNLKDNRYTLLFAVVGLLASFLWFWVCLGGKFWQTRWEQRLNDFESDQLPGLNFFSADRDRITDDVARGLSFHPSRGLKRIIYAGAVRHKPSVSYSMMLLALLFIFAWSTLTASCVLY